MHKNRYFYIKLQPHPFQCVFYRLQYDDRVNFNDLYNLGFSGSWESPFYFLGMRMCELIEKHENKDFLINYLKKNPTEFFLNYNKYAKAENNPSYYPVFDDKFESAMLGLHSN